MQKPVYSPREEQELMTQLWSERIRDDPETFVMFVFPWGQKDTPLEHMTGPRHWQRAVLRDVRDHIAANKQNATDKGLLKVLRKAVASGRGIGKSALVAWLILWFISTRIGGTGIVSANSESQLRTNTWGELTKWVTMALHSHWWEMSATRIQPATWLTTLVERDLKKGTRYWGAEGKLWSEENPDGYAGAHNMDGMLVIFDEASGIPDSIWSVANGFFTENIIDRYWFAFGNPRRNVGYFCKCFSEKRDFWQCSQIDARTVEDSDRSVYEAIIAEYGEDSYEARVEVYGEFPTESDDQFISPAIVSEAMTRAAWDDQSAPLILGVDPARGGNDSTVLLLRKGRDVVRIMRYKGDDTMTVAGHVAVAIREFAPSMTIIDEGGLGYGVLDRLTEQGFRVRGVNFGSKAGNPKIWGNKRAEMWGTMKNWLATASLPNDRVLKTDLTGPRRRPDSSGVIFLEGKKEMRSRGVASPDAADALSVTFAFPVAMQDDSMDSVIARALRQGNAVTRDYDPWERAAREMVH